MCVGNSVLDVRVVPPTSNHDLDNSFTFSEVSSVAFKRSSNFNKNRKRAEKRADKKMTKEQLDDELDQYMKQRK